jgi:hypothetical protein
MTDFVKKVYQKYPNVKIAQFATKTYNLNDVD